MSTTAASKLTCPRCGGAMEAGAQACPACGTAKPSRASATNSLSIQDKLKSVLLNRVRQVTHGEFDILDELGRGGMAVVYLAHDLPLDRRVAIKVMLPDYYSDSEMAERFKREARTAAGLSHPHIIPIYSVREIDDLLFFVMKYVAGRPLDTIVEADGRLPVTVVQAILTQVGSALAFAHRKGIVHRDIKPANVLIDEDGWAVVTDFGIAKVAQSRGLTMTGGTMGTPTYMSPEQCVGGEITGASDQYSLGIVAYQMLSGCLPFEADTVMSTMWAHVNEPPAPILNVRPDCPPTMATAIMRMLAKDPALRWATVADAVSAIGTATPDVGEKARVEMQALATGAAEVAKASGGAKRPAGSGSPATARLDRPEEPVAHVTVQPPAGNITVGETLKLNGLPKAANGAPLSRRRVTWTSSAPSVAAVSSDGIVTGVSEGTATITASCEGAVDVATVRIDPVPIAAVKVRPGRGALKVTESLQLAVELTDARGSEVPPRPVRWASSDPSVVSVNRDGLVQGIRPGSVLIAATLDGKRGVAQITVTPIPLAALLVTPRDPIIGIGESIQLHANPVDERGMTLPDRAVRWFTSAPEIVSVSESGEVLGRSLGTAKVTAQCEEKTVTVNVSARPVPIAHLVVEPSGGTMVVEERVQLHAEPQDASGRLLADRHVTWTSSDPEIIDVTPGGVAHARSAGTVKITASCEGHDATITAMVTRVGVASVELNSPVRNLEVGMETELHVITQDRFGQPLRKRFVQWASSNPDVVRVTPSGRVVALTPGAAQISAACGSYSDSVSITVTPPRVAHLKIEPSRCSIPEGWQKQFRAVVLSPTGEAISDVKCEWMVSDPTVATVSPEGVVTTHRPGSVMVAASADGKRATSRILVTVAG